MKKLALAFGALIMGFMITSCTGGFQKAEFMKDVDNYYTSLQQELAEITDVDEFLAFVEALNEDTELTDLLNEKYGDQEVSDEVWEEVEKFWDEKEEAYNTAEAKRCTEFITPLVDEFEVIVNQMYEKFQAGIPFTDDEANEFIATYFAIGNFNVCNNFEDAVNDRLNGLFDKEDEMSDLIDAKLDEMYPDEE